MNIWRNILCVNKQFRTGSTSLRSRNSENRKTKQNTRNKLKTYQKDDIRLKRGRYQISNVVGSSEDFGSKKKYWETHSKLKFSLCVVENCLNRATVGGHVWMKERTFQPWNKSKPTIYIVPLCQVYNWVLSFIKSIKTCQKLFQNSIFLVLFTWKM